MIYSLENENMVSLNDLEIEETLTSIGTDLIWDVLVDQVYNLNSNVDYLGPLRDRHQVLLEEFEENEEVTRITNEKMVSIYESVLNLLSDSFDLDFNIATDGSVEDLANYVYAVYYFLVIKCRKNIQKVYFKFIFNNKELITADYESEKFKDVETSVLKKVVKEKSDLALLAKCPDIFKSVVFNMDFESNELLEYTSNDEYWGSLVKELYENDKIFGNLFSKYQTLIREDSNLYNDVYCRVYNKLSKKILKKKGKSNE